MKLKNKIRMYRMALSLCVISALVGIGFAIGTFTTAAKYHSLIDEIDKASAKEQVQILENQAEEVGKKVEKLKGAAIGTLVPGFFGGIASELCLFHSKLEKEVEDRRKYGPWNDDDDELDIKAN